MNITEEIEKQVNAGFSAEEIMANLRNSSLSYAEIQQHIKAIKVAPSSTKPSPGKRSILMAIIVLIAAFSGGLSWSGRGYPGIGAIIICVGLFGFIIFVVSRFRKV